MGDKPMIYIEGDEDAMEEFMELTDKYRSRLDSVFRKLARETENEKR